MQAMISGRRGLAIVVDGGDIYRIDSSQQATLTSQTVGQVHILLNGALDIQYCEDVTFDRTQELLALAISREEALQLLLILQDSELPSDIRSEAATEAETLIADRYCEREVLKIFLSHPHPNASSLGEVVELLAGLQTPSVLRILQTIESHQPEIEVVHGGWRTIPERCFDDCDTERTVCRSYAVLHGIFRDIVCKIHDGFFIDEIYVDVALKSEDLRLPLGRQLLRAWFKHIALCQNRRLEQTTQDPLERLKGITEQGKIRGDMSVAADAFRQAIIRNNFELVFRWIRSEEAFLDPDVEGSYRYLHDSLCSLVPWSFKSPTPGNSYKILSSALIHASRRRFGPKDLALISDLAEDVSASDVEYTVNTLWHCAPVSVNEIPWCILPFGTGGFRKMVRDRSQVMLAVKGFTPIRLKGGKTGMSAKRLIAPEWKALKQAA